MTHARVEEHPVRPQALLLPILQRLAEALCSPIAVVRSIAVTLLQEVGNLVGPEGLLSAGEPYGDDVIAAADAVAAALRRLNHDAVARVLFDLRSERDRVRFNAFLQLPQIPADLLVQA